MKISDPKFLLKEPKSDSKTLISLFVRFNNGRFVYSTGESIHPKNWDFEAQRAKISRKNPENTEINAWLGKIDNEIMSICRNLKIEGTVPTPAILKRELSSKLNDRPVAQTLSLCQYIEKFIIDAETTKRKSTIKNYKTTYTHLLEYAKKRKVSLDFENIDIDFNNYFTQYLSKDKGISQNTLAKYIRTLKVFLNSATEEGINKNLLFRSKVFKKPVEDVHHIYLTESDIDKIYNLDLTGNTRLEKVRDLFIIGCTTGLRFSDFSALKPENIEGEFIKIKTIKTGENVVIPFSKRGKCIFDKYNCNFPSAISNQKMNTYLKELGELAGINETITISSKKAGLKTDITFKKYELITCHSARRSFATNAILAGISANQVMKITGHKNERVFQNYVRFSHEENAIKLKDHKFFNQ
jgi:integrase